MENMNNEPQVEETIYKPTLQVRYTKIERGYKFHIIGFEEN